MIIGITGTNGSGKGTVVEYLERKGFTHYSIREEIVAEIQRRGLPVDRPHMNVIGTELREEKSPTYFTDLFIKRATQEGNKNFLIESIRTVAEAENIKRHGGIIIATDADEPVRYERIVHRGTSTDTLSLDEFREQEAREMTSEDPNNPSKMNVRGVMKMADYAIRNDGSLDELWAQIDAVLAKL